VELELREHFPLVQAILRYITEAMSASTHGLREVSHCQFRDHTIIHQGNVQGNVYYGTPPYPPAHAEVVRVIPYPRNEDLVHRRDLIDKLDELLPQTTSGSYRAALWGLGGSGYVSTFGMLRGRANGQTNQSKTQIALDYAYRRCDIDKECCIFWVHADSEATFLVDYKTIGKKLGVDEWLEGTDLLDAVCNQIEGRSKWLMILDNADDLRLFGVGQQLGGSVTDESENQNLYKYVPCTSQGTVLWTSRDAHITGTLVGACRSIQVRSMAIDEATTLLATARGDLPIPDEAGVDGLLEELQCLPLAVSQAGAYMRRMSMTAEEYLSRLKQGNSRWEVLKVSDIDRHRRPEVSNSVLETWRISTERIRAESEISYRILHVIAYVDSQDIPHELIAAAANQFNNGSNNDQADQNSAMQVSELEVLTAVARLKEFSFLRLRQTDNGMRSYEMHKLVQEALQYGLKIHSLIETTMGRVLGEDDGAPQAEALYSGRALQVVDDLFPLSEPTSWARCEQYLRHAVRVGDWAEVSETEIETASMLERVSYFLYDRGRWREKESVNSRAWGLRRGVLKKKHPDTIRSMAEFGAACHAQGRYTEAQDIAIKVLELRQEVLGEKHPDTIMSIANLGATYHEQGRYEKAKELKDKALQLRQEILGEKHPDTIRTITEIGAIYHEQGRFEEAERLYNEALQLRREVLGANHPDTIRTMTNIAVTYHQQGQYDKALQLHQTALDLRRQVLGESHPDTIQSVGYLASTREALGYLPPLTESVQPSTIEQVHKSEGEGRLRDRLLRESMHQKVRRFYKWRSHKS
jgi:tetratricopeptide (TPR) repeat protein